VASKVIKMIFTFYSYKGGVGRSMALANVAELFYRVGYKVLMVDWDLEAPGLERFFPNPQEALDSPGVMDLLLDYQRLISQGLSTVNGEIVKGEDLPFQKPDDYAIKIYPKSAREGELLLITAGKRSKEHFAKYANSVLNFDWHDFYNNWYGELYFEWMRQQFNEMADVVLIDSRTGLTEMGGVCTYQFADVIVMFCAPNEQNLEGTYKMALDFKREDVQNLRPERPLNIIVVPSRVDDRAETDDLSSFYGQFIERYAALVPDELKKVEETILDIYHTSVNKDLVRKAAPFLELKIPYFPKYSFRETVAAHEPKIASEPLVGSYIKLAKAMQRFDSSLVNINILMEKELKTRIVDIEKKGDFASISEALREANPGDNIIILPGLYKETLIIDKPVKITGKGNISDIIIQAEENSAIIFQTTSGSISNLTLKQIDKRKNGEFFCIDITQGSPNIENCDISSESLGGIIVRGGSNPTLYKNRIHDCKQIGVIINNNSKGKFKENDIFGNESTGITISDNSDPALCRNHIHDNGKNGVVIYNDGKGILDDNEVSRNTLAGIEIKERGNPVLRRNQIHDGIRGGILIHSQGKGIIEENRIFSNALANVEISDKSNPTLLRNQIYESKQNGILINKNSKGTIECNKIYRNSSHNIEIDKGSSPELHSNEIYEGTNGIYTHGNSQPLIEENDIFNNAQAGVKVGLGKAVLRRNRIHDSKGVGIYIVDNGDSIIENNEIFSNSRIGVAIEGGEPILCGNRIIKNGWQAISIHFNGAGTIEDNDLRDNKKGPWDVAESIKFNLKISRNLE
jgi:parallel beta-helix repeat protein